MESARRRARELVAVDLRSGGGRGTVWAASTIARGILSVANQISVGTDYSLTSASGLGLSVTPMRKNEMRKGEQYHMQRGPTRGVRRVTLVAKDAPSGRSHWVMVRVEDGVGKGREIEVPSASLRPSPGGVSTKKPATRKPKRGPVGAPPGWVPVPGEAVTWTQTLGSRFTVIEVDIAKGVARIEGVLLGMTEGFSSPISELSPFGRQIEVVSDSELEARLADRLPEPARATREADLPESSADVERGPNFDIVARLVFSPGCIDAYRRRFARGAGRVEAERRLRHELEHDARQVRTTPKEYVRLQVPDRFEVPLHKRPMPLKPTMIERLDFAVRSQAGRHRKAA